CSPGRRSSGRAASLSEGEPDRRVRGPSGPAAERPGAGSTAATARRRTPEGEYDVTYPRTHSGSVCRDGAGPLDGFFPRAGHGRVVVGFHRLERVRHRWLATGQQPHGAPPPAAV